jgi:hypothetical protein
MSTDHKITYKCDVCGKESNNYRDIKTERIPVFNRLIPRATHEFDLCETCSQKLREVIRDHFVEVRHTIWGDAIIRKVYTDEPEKDKG